MVDETEPLREDEERSAVSAPGGRPVHRKGVLDSLERLVPALLSFVVLLGVWQAFVAVRDVPTIILPSPVDIATALADLYPTLLRDAAVTGVTAALGLAVGTAVGVLVAMGIVRSRSVGRVLLPYVVALRIAPMITIAPLLFLWFGRGIPARALVVATLTIFPIVIATVDGLRSTPQSYLALARSVDASPTTVFLRIRVPAAAPSIFAGLKIAATLSIIGAVVAEFVTLNAGLGYRVFTTATFLQMADSFAALTVLAGLGLLFYLAPAMIQRYLWLDDA